MAIANDIKALSEEIEASYGTRVAAVKDLVEETRQTLKGFQRDHKETAKALRVDLAKVKPRLTQTESQRLEDFKAINAGIKARIDGIVKETAGLLSDFRKEQEALATALKELLAESESVRLEDFKAMHAEITRHQRERIAEVKHLLGKFRKDQEEAHKHWQSLARAMAAKRAGKKAPKPEAPKKVTVEEAAEAKEEAPPEKPMTYREFFAYHRPRLKGTSKERMKKIGVMWSQYKRAHGIE